MPEKNPFLGATFAERKKIREAAESKQVDPDKVEDKAVAPGKTSSKRATRKTGGR